MFFEFKNTIMSPPQQAGDMYSQACSNDKITVDTWLPQWIENVKNTKKVFGSFKDRGLGCLYGINAYRPAIVIGSGPSLKNSVDGLKKANGIIKISCLHNFHFMVDNEIDVDYFVSLDAGPVVIDEISEGGKKSPQEYLDATKDKTLIAYIGSHPSLWENWKGKVILFNCPVPSEDYRGAVEKIEPFHTYVSTGGNVLGACTYIAKAIFGSNPIIFAGADFCFSYTRKFHAWDSKYDGKLGEAIRAIDIYGNSVLTWQSYYNFKVWFDWLSQNVPGIYINCTEGGLMGSYPEGNISSIKQMRLSDCLWMYQMFNEIKAQCENPEIDDKKVLF